MSMNLNRPCEDQEIEIALDALMRCQERGKWDLAALDKWLHQYPYSMQAAVKRLSATLDDLYTEVDRNEHASD